MKDSRMAIQIVTDDISAIAADWLMVFVPENEAFSASLQTLDEKLGGQLTRLKERGDLTGKAGEMVVIPDVPALGAGRLLLAGLGKLESSNVTSLQKTLMTAFRKITEKADLRAAVAVPEEIDLPISRETFVEYVVTSAVVGGAGQAFHKATPKRFPLKDVLLRTSESSSELEQAITRGGIIGQGINLARELVNRPPQEIYPESFADHAVAYAEEFGLECTVLDEDDLENEQMMSMLAVAVGSDRPARLVMLRWRGGGDGAPTLGLCGKGVTFDSGGLSLKPNEGMLTMKCDMAGAATVLGTMAAIARLNLPVNVIGTMGLVENMPSGSSFKLGDILRARTGTTIEVLNTDAEGRLVLADVLAYTIDQGATHLVDLATLTGACMVALGEDVTGVFTNNQGWCDAFLASAKNAGEDVWQMPMFDFYNELLESEVADVKNVGGRWGGAITAAKFLEKFVSERPWIHLDIAGPSFANSTKPHREGGATGVMVRTLIKLIENFPPSNAPHLEAIIE